MPDMARKPLVQADDYLDAGSGRTQAIEEFCEHPRLVRHSTVQRRKTFDDNPFG